MPQVIISGRPRTIKQIRRSMECDVAKLEDAKSVAALFRGFRKESLDQLCWLSATKRGRRLICEALQELHSKDIRAIDAMVADIVAKKKRPARKRR